MKSVDVRITADETGSCFMYITQQDRNLRYGWKDFVDRIGKLASLAAARDVYLGNKVLPGTQQEVHTFAVAPIVADLVMEVFGE